MAKDRVKNRNDLRYLKVQARLDKVLSKYIRQGHIAGMKIKEVSHAADIYQSTFYDHHRNLDAAMSYMDTKMEKSLRAIVREAVETKCGLEILYSKILFFMGKNKEYYGAVMKQKMATPLILITKIARPAILADWKRYNYAGQRRTNGKAGEKASTKAYEKTGSRVREKISWETSGKASDEQERQLWILAWEIGGMLWWWGTRGHFSDKQIDTLTEEMLAATRQAHKKSENRAWAESESRK